MYGNGRLPKRLFEDTTTVISQTPLNSAPQPPEPTERGSRRQTLVQGLLADVFHGRLRPGQHLVTQHLAERFGVSHTPIREALIELAGTGVIDLLPNRGAIVRRVTPQDVRELCQTRRILECAATKLACGRIEFQQLHALAEEFRWLLSVTEATLADYVARARALDSQLHDLIAASCSNRYLAQEIGRLKILFRAFRDVAWEREEARNDPHRIVIEAREHLGIVEALIAGGAQLAARCMGQHIASGARYWSRALPADPPPV